ncbi:MAG: hypothetical protein JST86_05960 [Bacteroidetes bacterium]|nr:hypothetical protein [Bacteroidota bacterium]
MKNLLMLLLLIAVKCVAQMPQADMNMTGAGQPVLVEMQGVKNNKVTYIRETAYVVDTNTHQANMQQVDKITVYSIAYFQTTPLLVQLQAVFGKDTTKLVRNEQYSFDPKNGLLMSYQVVADDGFESGTVGQVARNAEGLITGKSIAVTFNLKAQSMVTNYTVQSIGGKATSPENASFNYSYGNKPQRDNIRMVYDDKGRLTSSTYTYSDNKSIRYDSWSYDADGRLQVTHSEYTYETSEYKPATDGVVAFGIYVPGTPAKTIKKNVTDTNDIRYRYDAKGNINTIVYEHNNNVVSKEEYTYNDKGIPLQLRILDSKGRLTALKKFSCQ